MFFFLWVENASESDRKDLLSELELMKNLRPHPHVIKLMGCVTKSGKIKNLLVLRDGTKHRGLQTNRF